jgi:hypothetical protein
MPLNVAAFSVYGAIGEKYSALGGAGGPLGSPASDESDALNGGRFNNFQNGFIYWHPNLGAHAVYGLIGEKWNQLGREKGVLGYPTSDEFQEGSFRRSNFQYGFIRWSQAGGVEVFVNGQPYNVIPRMGSSKVGGPVFGPAPGPQAVPQPSSDIQPYGLIGAAWGGLGGPNSPLGKPVTPEQDVPGRPGRVQSFEHGQISWTPNTGSASMLIAYQAGNAIEILWGGTEPYNYDFWMIRTDKDGYNISQKEVKGSRVSGWYVLRDPFPGARYSFVVQGCDEKGFLGEGQLAGCRQGWLNQVSVTLKGNPIKLSPTFPDPAVREDLCFTNWECLKARYEAIKPYLQVATCAGSVIAAAGSAGAATAAAVAACAGLSLSK